MLHSSILQGGYAHPLSRKWQAKRQLTKSMFMYPIFITDDENASVEIATLPGQRRWGVNKLEEFIGPLVKKGLESVILFGVPLNCNKVCPLPFFLVFPLKSVMYRTDEEHQQMTFPVPSFLLSKSFASSTLLYTSHAMFVFANTLTTDIVVFYMMMELSTPHLPSSVLLKLLSTMLGLEQIVLLLVT